MNLIYLSRIDLKKEINPTVSISDLVLKPPAFFNANVLNSPWVRKSSRI